MVNTRKKAQIPTAGEAGLNSGDLSDSSTVSTASTQARRLTRRSVGSINAQSLQEEVVMAPSPLRRSRRLSNCSVESIPTTDTQPPVASLARRPIRGKAAPSDSDVEVLVIKRRKVAEPVENLVPIVEEKTEGDAAKDEPEIVDLDTVSEAASYKSLDDGGVVKEEKEVFETPCTSPNLSITTEGTPAKDVKSEDIKTVESSPKKPEAESAPVIIGIEDSPSINSKEKTVTTPEKAPQQEVRENESVSTTEDIAIPTKEEVSKPEQPKELKPVSPVKAVKITSPSSVTTETLPPKAPIQERLMKIVNKSPRLPLKSKPGKAAEKPKPPLPCGADVMRNIPRGKSKSGREWKDPKSNPRYLYQDKGLKMPFEKITQLRTERKRVKELENRLKEEEQARRAEITRRREINKKREEENSRRGEIVQVIRNPNKIKRMKKKQLKLIQKRDTTSMV